MPTSDKIQEELGRYQRESHKREVDFIAVRKSVRSMQRRLAENLIITDSGMTVYTNNAGIALSKGCLACKAGRWLCVQVGHCCNAGCVFCPQVNTAKRNEPEGAFADLWMHDVRIYAELFAQDHISGISYTGGEPLIYLDNIVDVASEIATRCPGIYQWIYTNGILADKTVFDRLRKAGISEIRFNLAATDFAEGIIDRVGAAKAYFKRVTVEVPSTPETYRHLVHNGKVSLLAKCGVRQINLSELFMVTPRAWETYGRGKIYTYRSLFAGPLRVPVFSRKITYAIMRYVIANDIDLLVNDCSHDTKHLQNVKKNMNPFLRHFKSGGSRRPVWQL